VLKKTESVHLQDIIASLPHNMRLYAWTLHNTHSPDPWRLIYMVRTLPRPADKSRTVLEIGINYAQPAPWLIARIGYSHH